MLNKFNNPVLVREMVGKVYHLADEVSQKLGRPPIFMEVCGTHTVSISRSGLRDVLKGLVELRSGPGCPVCVTAAEELDKVITLARLPGITVATFGDMLRVPGSGSTLEKERAKGTKVKVIYSPYQAVEYASLNPGEEVVLIAVGFETTAPLNALVILEAQRQQITNFSILSLHKLVPPALRALLTKRGLAIDGLILPGHVCAVTGCKAFDFIAKDYNKPAVVAGFEPLDILEAVYLLLKMLKDGYCQVVNGYRRVVKDAGNAKAKDIIATTFNVDKSLWRGLGWIDGTGLFLKDTYQNYDAALKFHVTVPPKDIDDRCRCGQLIIGQLTPPQCPLFGNICTPVHPMGPCMVSTEGACGAYYQYDLGSD